MNQPSTGPGSAIIQLIASAFSISIIFLPQKIPIGTNGELQSYQVEFVIFIFEHTRDQNILQSKKTRFLFNNTNIISS